MIFLFITNFGDLAVLLPLVAIFGLWLVALRRPVALLWWLLAFALCVGGTVVLKMYFYVCPLTEDLHSPSGHTSLSTLVYGAPTVVAVLGTRGWRRWLAAASGALVIGGIATTRIVIDAHTVIEVVFGFAIGSISLALFAYGYRRHPPADRRLWPLFAAFAVAMLLLNGDQLRLEELIHWLAVYLNIGRIGCA